MEINRIVESLESIINLGEKLLTTFDIEELLRELVKSMQEMLHADGATLYLIDPVEKLLISQVILSDRVEGIILPVESTSIAGYSAINRVSLNIPDVYADLSHIHKGLKFNRAIDEAYHYKTRNILTYPLILKGEVLGVFQVVNKRDGEFNESDQRILKNFAVLAAIAIYNARLVEKIMEEQEKKADIVEHISDEVIFVDREGKILSLNSKALDKMPRTLSRAEAVQKHFAEVFPHLSGLSSEVKKVVDQNLDKTFYGGRMPFVLLTIKNNRQLVEKIIIIVKKPETRDDEALVTPQPSEK